MKDFYKNFPENNTINLLYFVFKWVMISSILGGLTGFFIYFFIFSLKWATTTRLNNPWLLFLLPFGGALVSYLYMKFGKTSSKGNNLIIENVNLNTNDIPLRMASLVFFGTIVTHLFGGSAGREGTAVQIGGTLSAFFCKALKLNKKEHRILIMAGISSGFGAMFGTPLAGAIFGLEVCSIGGMTYEALIPCFTGSFVGNLVTRSMGVTHTHYNVTGLLNNNIDTMFKVLIAGILFGLTSRLFSSLTHFFKAKFSKTFKNAALKSFVGGLIIIALVYILGTREYLGLSLDLLNNAFNSTVPYTSFILKLIFTAITLGAGFQGGEVTPLFVIGSSLGFVLALIFHVPTSIFAALGLVGVFNGATNTPISSFALGIEMFGSNFAIYIFIVCIASYIFSGHSGIYTSQKIGNYKYTDYKKEAISTDLTLDEYRKSNKK